MNLWRLKILVKIVLSRLPIGYAIFRRIGIFRHGAMDSASYAVRVFQAHFTRARERGLGAPFTALEVGPGDSVVSAVLARSAGADVTWLIDVGKFATEDMRMYGRTVELARLAGLAVPDDLNLGDLASLLKSCHAHYLSAGLKDFSYVPSASVDFIWSHAVLEHVRAGEMESLVSEMFRVLRPGGIASHRVDLKDHLGGGLNNLRFSDECWESPLMANSGFYTNRLRFGEMLDLFGRAGFGIEVVSSDRWASVPISRRVLAKRFRALSDDELCVRGFDVILRRPSKQPPSEVEG